MTHDPILRKILTTLITSSVLFSILAILVANGVTRSFDEQVLLWVNQHANDTFNAIFIALTELGGVYCIGVVSIFLTVFLLVKKQYYKALFVTFTMGGIALFNIFLKTLFDRTRPDLWEHLVTETSFSFPSGHSSASAALAFVVVLLLWRTKWRTLSIILGVVYVLAIGLSRMYLGVHFPTDVLGGWLLGLTWVAFVAGCILLAKTKKNNGAKL